MTRKIFLASLLAVSSFAAQATVQTTTFSYLGLHSHGSSTGYGFDDNGFWNQITTPYDNGFNANARLEGYFTFVDDNSDNVVQQNELISFAIKDAFVSSVTTDKNFVTCSSDEGNEPGNISYHCGMQSFSYTLGGELKFSTFVNVGDSQFSWRKGFSNTGYDEWNSGPDSSSSHYRDVTPETVITISTTPVPEPETYAMLGVGLGILAWAQRRRAV
jgi:PEP-CTERM motif